MPRTLVLHALIHCALALAFFLPGGFFWNRPEITVFGLPFSVFSVAIALPLMIFVNMIVCVVRIGLEERSRCSAPSPPAEAHTPAASIRGRLND